MPAIDLVAGLDRSNPPDDVIEALEQDRYYRWITYLFLPIQYAGFVGAFWLIGGGGRPDRSLDKVGLAISIGCIGGIGINTAHELGHKREANERWLSKIALAQSFYGHFYIEHNRGHHVRVATPEDPASRAGRRELLPVLAAHGARLAAVAPGAWRSAATPAGKQHPFRLGNDVLNAWLMSAVLWGALVAWLGVGILPLPGDPGGRRLLAARGRQLHGALRDAAPEGRRRRAAALRAGRPQRTRWNSNNIATNVLLYHLQRHSDHHANPTRRYQTLRDFEESPVLPTGYAGMIVLAIVPAGLAPGDGPAGARALRRRPVAAPTSARASATGSWRRTRRRRSSAGGGLDRPTARASRARPGGRGAGRPLPGLRLHLRGRAPATSARASRPAPRGPTSPTTGAAPTAACATRSTSCRWSRRRLTDRHGRQGAAGSSADATERSRLIASARS